MDERNSAAGLNELLIDKIKHLEAQIEQLKRQLKQALPYLLAVNGRRTNQLTPDELKALHTLIPKIIDIVNADDSDDAEGLAWNLEANDE